MNLRQKLKRQRLEAWEIRQVLRSRKQRLERVRLNKLAERGRALIDMRPRLATPGDPSGKKPRAAIQTSRFAR